MYDFVKSIVFIFQCQILRYSICCDGDLG